jgi:hypothetical protein
MALRVIKARGAIFFAETSNARIVMTHLARDQCADWSRRAISLRAQPDAIGATNGIDIA